MRAIRIARVDQCSTNGAFYIVGDNEKEAETVNSGSFQNKILEGAGRLLFVVGYTGFSVGPVLNEDGKLIDIITGAPERKTYLGLDSATSSPFTITVSFDHLKGFMKEVRIYMHTAIHNESNNDLNYQVI